MDKHLKSDFCIVIDYKKDSENPSRVFEAMAALIKSFQDFDKDLIKTIDNKIETVLLLEDIEISSLKTWLANVLRGVPDEAVKDLDWKKAVGSYLVKAKHIVVKRLEGKTIITDAKVIEDIQYEIVEEARKTDIKLLPNYTPLQLPKLLENIDKINKSLEYLSSEDKATMKSEFGDATFNLELSITPSELEDLVTRETVSNETVMILKVRKPDYLGNTMWDFKHGSRSVPAKILHEEWLKDFQQRKIDIRPGDSIRAKVKTEVKYGHDFEVIGYNYDVLEVQEVIQDKPDSQAKFPFEGSV